MGAPKCFTAVLLFLMSLHNVMKAPHNGATSDHNYMEVIPMKLSRVPLNDNECVI